MTYCSVTIVGNLNANRWMRGELQHPKRALHRNKIRRDIYRNTLRQNDWFLSNARHGYPLRDDAQHFAADMAGAGLAVSHDPLGCRHDRHTQTVHHRRNTVGAPINSQTWP